MIDQRAVFIKAVTLAPDMPADIKAGAETVDDLRLKVVDQSYIAFLDEQIRLCARGEEWNNVLKKRREALIPNVGTELVDGIITTPVGRVFVKIEPRAPRVLYWEQWNE
jgi:hypothetical protein